MYCTHRVKQTWRLPVARVNGDAVDDLDVMMWWWLDVDDNEGADV